MNNKYSQKISQILQYSKEEAQRLGNDYIGPEHLLLAILRDGNSRGFDALSSQFHIDTHQLRSTLEEHTRASFNALIPSANIELNEKSSSIMRLCILESRLMRSAEADTDHLLLAIVKQKDNLAARVLEDSGLTYGTLHTALTQPATAPKANIDLEDDDEDTPPGSALPGDRQIPLQKQRKGRKDSDTPAIDMFGTDITKAAAEGKLDPVVGRTQEIERIAQILSRRKKNNPVLIGEPGVGKSAIVEGLALRISERKVSRTLIGKRIVALDMSSIVAGTKYRGQFEERMTTIINELKAHPEVIIFIDEIHTIIGAGNAAGTMDAANMMKPALSRGELQCIGATTLDEYRKSIEKDGALERRFQKLVVEPTTEDQTLTILHNIRDRYEEHHNVTYTEAALQACVRLTARYVTDRAFPDKAIDALDEAGSRVHITSITVPSEIEEIETKIQEKTRTKNEAVANADYEQAIECRQTILDLQSQLDAAKAKWEEQETDNRQTVDEDHVAEAVSMMTGVPVQRMAEAEGIRLKGMRQTLKSKVIAQDEAIDKVVRAIQRNRVGLNDPNRPIGTFMFLGPTGVGKTYLAKQLALYMFGSADALVRIDMSEYMEKFTVSRLVGAPPGYVGYEEGGMLTEKVRRHPYSIVLLDEIEKAHGDVFNLLLQVLDDGRLTDSNGRTVDFRNTVIIMTSNVGTRQYKEFGRGVGFSAMAGKTDREVGAAVIRKALNRQFSPEFLNRVDDIITFDQLDLEAILQIIDIELRGLYSRIDALGYQLQIDAEAKHFIAEQGYDKQFGARPLRRSIQQHLEDPISDLIVEGDLRPGAILRVRLTDDQHSVHIDAE